jgi:hypothetical protein
VNKSLIYQKFIFSKFGARLTQIQDRIEYDSFRQTPQESESHEHDLPESSQHYLRLTPSPSQSLTRCCPPFTFQHFFLSFLNQDGQIPDEKYKFIVLKKVIRHEIMFLPL